GFEVHRHRLILTQPRGAGATGSGRPGRSGVGYGPAPAGIAAAGEVTAGWARDRLHAAEVEVALGPALDPGAAPLQACERRLVDARLRMHHASLEVGARGVDGILGGQPARDETEHGLQHRR